MGVDLPPAVIAAMAEQLESALAGCASSYKPAKIGVPSEGPWRESVRGHLGRSCGCELELLDAAAARARAVPIDTAIFANPAHDAAHRHAPATDALEAVLQMPADPELAAETGRGAASRPAPGWMIREFEETLAEVNERVARAGPDDPLIRLRLMLDRIDNLAEGACPEQLDQAELFVGIELGRRSETPDRALGPDSRGMRDRGPLPSLDELFERALVAEEVGGREIGGRSL
jgi:hypothetical protein